LVATVVIKRMDTNDFTSSTLSPKEKELLKEHHFLNPGAVAVMINAKLDLANDFEEITEWTKIFAIVEGGEVAEVKPNWLSKRCNNYINAYIHS
jgi:hypothetical protein